MLKKQAVWEKLIERSFTANNFYDISVFEDVVSAHGSFCFDVDCSNKSFAEVSVEFVGEIKCCAAILQ